MQIIPQKWLKLLGDGEQSKEKDSKVKKKNVSQTTVFDDIKYSLVFFTFFLKLMILHSF